jgi:hypothetical protein
MGYAAIIQDNADAPTIVELVLTGVQVRCMLYY